MCAKKNSGGGELKKLRSSMGTLYGEPWTVPLVTFLKQQLITKNGSHVITQEATPLSQIGSHVHNYMRFTIYFYHQPACPTELARRLVWGAGGDYLPVVSH